MRLFDFGWESLSKMGTQGLVRSSYFWVAFIPLAAKLLENLQHTYTIDLFREPFVVVLVLPYTWKLFYFGSVFLALATLLFSVRCPAVISQYKTSKEFIEKTNSEFILRTEIINASIRLGNQRLLGDFTDWFCQRQSRKPSVDRVDITSETVLSNYFVEKESVTDAFYFVRQHVNYERPVERRICAVLYAIGLAFFAVVAWQSFFSVVKIAVR